MGNSQQKDKLDFTIEYASLQKININNFGFGPFKKVVIVIQTYEYYEGINSFIIHQETKKDVVSEPFYRDQKRWEGFQYVQSLQINSTLTIRQAEEIANKGLNYLMCGTPIENGMTITSALGSLRYGIGGKGEGYLLCRTCNKCIQNKLDQKIVSAYYLKRKLNSSGSGSGFGPFKHQGILVQTDQNYIFMIHHKGIFKDVESEIFSEELQEEDWELVQSIEVNSQLTIRKAEQLGGKGNWYLFNGTCIGVRMMIQNALNKGIANLKRDKDLRNNGVDIKLEELLQYQ